jgi:Ferritin-like domain
VSAGAAPSRRGLLTGAAAVAGSALLGACGRASVPGPPVVPVRNPTPEQSRQDTPILLQAIALERRTVAAYIAAIPLLRPAERVWAKSFLDEELEHVGEVITLLRLAGTTVPDPAPSYAIGHPHDSAGALRVLDQLEALQTEQWMQWIPRLSAGTMRAAAASVVANDAQHLAALRGALGRPSLSSAFVAGPRPEAAA